MKTMSEGQYFRTVMDSIATVFAALAVPHTNFRSIKLAIVVFTVLGLTTPVPEPVICGVAADTPEFQKLTAPFASTVAVDPTVWNQMLIADAVENWPPVTALAITKLALWPTTTPPTITSIWTVGVADVEPNVPAKIS